MRAANDSIGRLLRLFAGLIVWASAFVMLYAGSALGCRHLSVTVDAGLANPVTLGLLAIAGLHMALLLGLLVYRHRRPTGAAAGETERSRRFRDRVEGLILLAALVALVLVAFPLLMVPPCAG